eukprot:2919505-Pleurochrysis_carterae.AAC.2
MQTRRPPHRPPPARVWPPPRYPLRAGVRDRERARELLHAEQGDRALRLRNSCVHAVPAAETGVCRDAWLRVVFQRHPPHPRHVPPATARHERQVSNGGGHPSLRQICLHRPRRGVGVCRQARVMKSENGEELTV